MSFDSETVKIELLSTLLLKFRPYLTMAIALRGAFPHVPTYYKPDATSYAFHFAPFSINELLHNISILL